MKNSVLKIITLSIFFLQDFLRLFIDE